MNQKGFINILLIVIVVALVGAGAYFVSTRQVTPPTPSSTSTPSPTSTTELEPSPTPEPTPSPTSNTSQGSLQIDPSSATVKVGDSATIKAMFTQPLRACVDRGEVKCAPYEIDTSFVSDNPGIAEVSIAHSPIPNCTQSPGVTCMDSHWITKGISPGTATISTKLDASFPPVIYYLKDPAQRIFTAKMQVTVVVEK